MSVLQFLSSDVVLRTYDNELVKFDSLSGNIILNAPEQGNSRSSAELITMRIITETNLPYESTGSTENIMHI